MNDFFLQIFEMSDEKTSILFLRYWNHTADDYIKKKLSQRMYRLSDGIRICHAGWLFDSFVC